MNQDNLQTSSDTARRNPYVGPRTFESQDEAWYFGREGEARDLLSLVIAERMTLFYSPSGAGKSSLLNVRLIPDLWQEANYLVLPVGRVGGELPTGVDDVDNIYAFNLMLSLDQQAESDPSRFAQISLQEFMAGLHTSDGKSYIYEGQEWAIEQSYDELTNNEWRISRPPHVLIIDQFEEIITTHPGRWRERRAFFQQLADAMRADPLLWVVLTLREDFVANLDPFTQLVPGGMTNRFYMERMGVDAALQAIQRPAAKEQCPFAPDVAETLVDNLRQIQVQTQDENKLGQYLEPVQLQVVCYQLWEKLRVEKMDQEAPTITLADLEQSGNVDNALADFYEQAIRDVLAQESNWLSERELRGWFDEELITQADTRGTFYRGKQTAGMRDSVIELLQDRFLLRTEVRAGGTWVELVHDRFVAPIQQSNQIWRNDYNNPLYRAYQRWQNQGQQNVYLLSGASLEEAQRFAEDNPLDVQVEEQLFLQRSHDYSLEQELVAQQAEKTRRRNTWIAGATMAVLLLFAGFALYGMIEANRQSVIAMENEGKAIAESTAAAQSAEEAEVARATAEWNEDLASVREVEAQEFARISEENSLLFKSRNLVSQSDLVFVQEPSDPSLSILLALEAVDVTLKPDGAVNSFVDGNLWSTAQKVESLGFRENLPSEQHKGEILSVRFNSEGTKILTAGEDQTIRLWNASDGSQDVIYIGHADWIFDAIFIPNERIATTGNDGTIRIWDTETGQQLDMWQAHNTRVRTLDVTQDGEYILSASQDGAARIWNLTDPTAREEPIFELRHNDDAWILSAKFSPDGTKIATVGADSTARLWDAATGEQLGDAMSNIPEGHSNNWQRNVAFTPDGAYLVTVAARGSIHVWDTESQQEFYTSTEHGEQQVHDIAISDDGTYWVTIANMGQIFLWEWDGSQAKILKKIGELSSQMTSVDFSANNDHIATTDADGTIRVWELSSGKELLRIGGHLVDLNSLAYSPDGTLLASAGKDDTIWFWNPESGQLLDERKIEADDNLDQIHSLAFHPTDESLLLVAGENGIVQLSDVATGQVITPLLGYTSTVSSAAFSPDGKRIVTAGKPHNVYVWDAVTGEQIHALVGHTATVHSAVFSNIDSEKILTGSDDETARIWDANSGDQLALLSGYRDGVRAIAFSPDDQTIATGSDDGSLRIWDVATEQLLLNLRGHNNRISTVKFSSDNILLTASHDRTARLWDLETGDEIRRLIGHTSGVKSAVFSPDGQTIATTGGDDIVKLWDTLVPEYPREFRGHKIGTIVRYATFNRDDSLVISTDQNGDARLWDAQSTKELRYFKYTGDKTCGDGGDKGLWTAVFTPDEQMILTAGRDGTIRFWNVGAQDEEQKGVQGQSTEITESVLVGTIESCFTYADFSPHDESLLATASDDGIARLWRWEDDQVKIIQELTGHKFQVLHAAFSPTDDNLLATSSADGTVRLWNLERGTERQSPLEGHNNWVWFVAFSPDGQQLVTSGGDGTARVWNVQSGEEQFVLSGHTLGLVRAAQFSPDGQTIVTAGEDRTARVWDASTGKELRTLEGHSDDVWYAVFSHAGDTILTASFDGTLRLWDETLEAAMGRASALIQREPPIFTAEEKGLYSIDE